MVSRTLRVENIVGLKEACAIVGLNEGMFTSLRSSDPSFPKPIRVVAETSLWDSVELRKWKSDRILASARRAREETAKAAPIPRPAAPIKRPAAVRKAAEPVSTLTVEDRKRILDGLLGGGQ